MDCENQLSVSAHPNSENPTRVSEVERDNTTMIMSNEKCTLAKHCSGVQNFKVDSKF